MPPDWGRDYRWAIPAGPPPEPQRGRIERAYLQRTAGSADQVRTTGVTLWMTWCSARTSARTRSGVGWLPIVPARIALSWGGR